MSDTEIKRYCIDRSGNDMVQTDYGAFCFHHEIKDLIEAKNARIAELEERNAMLLRRKEAYKRLYRKYADAEVAGTDLGHRDEWMGRALDAEAKLRKVEAVLVEGINVREALQEMADNPEVREKVAAEMMLPGTQL